jgi:hypothetical protein
MDGVSCLWTEYLVYGRSILFTDGVSCLWTGCLVYGRGILSVDSKTIPVQAWTGLEGSRKLRFLDFMTTAHEGGKVVSLTHRPPLLPRK